MGKLMFLIMRVVFYVILGLLAITYLDFLIPGVTLLVIAAIVEGVIGYTVGGQVGQLEALVMKDKLVDPGAAMTIGLLTGGKVTSKEINAEWLITKDGSLRHRLFDDQDWEQYDKVEYVSFRLIRK